MRCWLFRDSRVTKYGVEIKSDDEGIEDVFGSVRNLATFLERHTAQRPEVE